MNAFKKALKSTLFNKAYNYKIKLFYVLYII